MRNKSFAIALVGAVSVCASAALGMGLAGGPYVIDPLDVNGGGTRCTGGVYTLTASTGQAGGIGAVAAGAYGLNDGFWPAAIDVVHLADSAPPEQGSLSRSENNIIRLTFDNDIVAATAGEVLVQEMLAGGGYGADLSSRFGFSVESDGNGDPCVLKLQENGTVLAHRHRYAVRNAGGWGGVASFAVQYVAVVGDANGDGYVDVVDLLILVDAFGTYEGYPAYDIRCDFNGDGAVDVADLLDLVYHFGM